MESEWTTHPLLQTHRNVSFSTIQTLFGTQEACPLTQGSSVSMQKNMYIIQRIFIHFIGLILPWSGEILLVMAKRTISSRAS